MEAMIFAAGLGTRLQNETAKIPKALVKIGNKTLLQLAIEKLKTSGISSIVINVHHFAHLLTEYIQSNDFGIDIKISDESEKLLDTGGGLKKASALFSRKTPIILYNVDIISSINIEDLVDFHSQKKALATLSIRHRDTQRYLKFDNDFRLAGWMNKKTGEEKIARPKAFNQSTEFAFSGIHVIDPRLFNWMPETDKFSIIDLYLHLAKSQPVYGFYDNSDLWIDVGKPKQLEMARQIPDFGI